MLTIITTLKKRLSTILFPPISTHTFPEKGIPVYRILQRHRQAKKEHLAEKTSRMLGWLITPPSAFAVNIYKKFLPLNPNHLGNWSNKKPQAWGTRLFEQEVIQKMIHLYHATNANLQGYITSGATEGNLYSAWMGIKKLEKSYTRSQVCLIQTSTTHYSLQKTASILGIPCVTTPLNPKDWNMDSKGLIQTISQLYSTGMRGFLIPLTLGYTNTGTSDNIATITTTVTYLKKRYKHCVFYLWCDAALNGLTLPFIDRSFAPFSSPLIQTLVVDFHKFGQVPYPAGIVLHRATLQKYIETPIDYLPETDSTLLGSRTGIPSVIIWSMLHKYGFTGMKKIVETQLTHKQYLLSNLQKLDPTIRIISDHTSLTCGVIFPQKIAHLLQNSRNNTYGLYAKPSNYVFTDGTKNLLVFKLYFLPHVTHSVLNDMLLHIRTQYTIK